MFWTCRFLLQQLPDNRILKLKLLKSKLLHCLPHATACILREMLINEARVLCFPKQSIINLLGWLHHSFTVESDCFDFERWFSSFQFTTVKCNTIIFRGEGGELQIFICQLLYSALGQRSDTISGIVYLQVTSLYF